MNSMSKAALFLVVATAPFILSCSGSKPQSTTGHAPTPPPAATTDPSPVPAHHKTAEAAGSVQVLAPENFKDAPKIAEVYRMAGRIRGVLAQQPCYCHCDRMGHGSLLDCFATDHGAG